MKNDEEKAETLRIKLYKGVEHMGGEEIGKEQTYHIMREITSETEAIINATDSYCQMISQEYGETNLYFLKLLGEMFATGEEKGGIGAKATHLSEACNQASHILNEYYSQQENAVEGGEGNQLWEEREK